MKDNDDLITRLQGTDKINEQINFRPVSDAIHDIFPYLAQLFHAGLAKRHGIRLSIQCTPDGSFRGSINAVENLGESTELGIIAYTSADSVGGVFEYFEDALSYNDVKWRPDKYWLEKRSEAPKSAPKRVKIDRRL